MVTVTVIEGWSCSKSDGRQEPNVSPLRPCWTPQAELYNNVRGHRFSFTAQTITARRQVCERALTTDAPVETCAPAATARYRTTSGLRHFQSPHPHHLGTWRLINSGN